MSRLTKTRIDQAKVGEKEYFLWDSTISGFGLRVYPSGRKTFVYQYRIPSGGTRKYTIGRYPSITPHQARKKVVELTAKVVGGGDPSAEKHKLKHTTTLADLCDLYTAEGCDHKKPSTKATDKGRIEQHIKPLLGQKVVGDITSDDVAKFIKDVTNGKTAKDIKTEKRGGRARVTGGKGTASRTTGLLGGILTFGIQKGLRDTNPVRGVKKPKDQKRERFLSGDELERTWKFLRNPTGLRLNPNAAPALLLLLLTGARKNEILSLKWSYLDRESRHLKLPDSKTGPKKLPLNSEAMHILDELPVLDGDPYVFSSNRGAHYTSLQKDWCKIQAHLKLVDVNIHDLRHSTASILAEQGYSLLQIGQILGHADPRTTQIYAHLAEKKKSETVGAVGDYLAKYDVVKN